MPFVEVETPSGLVYIEVDEYSGRLPATSDKQIQQKLNESLAPLKDYAAKVLGAVNDLSPTEVKISFGIKATVEADLLVFGLAKAGGEASYMVDLKWTKETRNATK
jgi:hypothetical protein